MEKRSRSPNFPLPARLAGAAGIFLLAGSLLGGDGRLRKSPPLCGAAHAGGGALEPLEPAEVRRAYRDLKARLEAALGRAPAELSDFLFRPHGAEFPSCLARTRRIERPEGADLAALPCPVLYVVSLEDPERLRLPKEVLESEEAAIGLLSARRVSDAAVLAERRRRPVHLVSPDLARKLGVRCSGTLLRVAEKGEALELCEAP
jgi:hypothetical protein